LILLVLSVLPSKTLAVVKIGMSAPFSGEEKYLGTSLYHGAKAYFDFINKSGGILGSKIRLVAYDDQNDFSISLKNTLKLINKDRVSWLFNYVGDKNVSQVLPYLRVKQGRIVHMVFPHTSLDYSIQSPYAPYLLNIRYSTRFEVQSLVEKLVKTGYKKIGVFYETSAYGREGYKGLNDGIKKNRMASLKALSINIYLYLTDFYPFFLLKWNFFI